MKTRFTYRDEFNNIQVKTLTIAGDMVPESKMTDEEVQALLCEKLQKAALLNLKAAGYIAATRRLLYLYPMASDIKIEILEDGPTNSKNSAGSAVGIMIALALIAAIICFPLLVMLGMRGKLFLKNLYSKCSGEAYETFVKNYTFIGIGLYALVVILIAVDNIFKLFMLTTPAIGILFFGGIAYFIVSLVFINKNILPEGEKINPLETLKKKFAKKPTEEAAPEVEAETK